MNILESEAGRLQAWDQPELHNKTLSQNKQNNNNKKTK